MPFGDKWAHRLALEGIIPAEDEALYSYGLRQSGVFLLNIVTILLLGYCLGMLGESIVFIVAYFPIRRMAGGYHARTQWACYLWGIVLIVAVLMAVRLLAWNLPLSVILLLVSGGVIFAFSPVEDQNKPLDEQEAVHYRRRARQFWVVEIALYFILVMGEAFSLAMTLTVALTALSVMLILGRIKNSAGNK